MEKKYFAPSELIINEDGSIFHLHLKPENLADKVILVGDPGRVALVASHFENKNVRFLIVSSVLSQVLSRERELRF